MIAKAAARRPIRVCANAFLIAAAVMTLSFVQPASSAVSVLATLLSAVCGGLLLRTIRFPAGMMVGAIVGAALLNVVTDRAYFPADMKLVTQIIAGAFVGMSLDRSKLRALSALWRGALITVTCVITFSLGIGLTLYSAARLDLPTALFSAAPGGMVDMVLASMDMGADTTTVSVMQVIRFIYIVAVFPTLTRIIIRRFKPARATSAQASEASPQGHAHEGMRWGDLALTAAVAAVFGWFGKWIGMPAGALVFSMLGTTLLNVFFGRAYMPPAFKLTAQAMAGALVGIGVTAQALGRLQSLIGPALLMLVMHTLSTVINSAILYRFSGLDYTTAFFSCSPGGATDLSLLADEFGASAATVSLIQVARMVATIAFYPALCYVLSQLPL